MELEEDIVETYHCKKLSAVMVKGNDFIKRVIVAGDGEVEGQGS